MSKFQLIETSRVINGGQVSGSEVMWSTGRVGAKVTRGEIVIRRQLGFVGDRKITLNFAELEMLNQLCCLWQIERSNWSAFFGSSAGYPPGTGSGAEYYQPAGENSEPIKVAQILGGKLTKGERLRGQKQERPLSKVFPAGQIEPMSEIWRVGERQGHPDGQLIGMKYQLSSTFGVEAFRRELVISSRNKWTTLESTTEEEFFIGELLAWAKNFFPG